MRDSEERAVANVQSILTHTAAVRVRHDEWSSVLIRHSTKFGVPVASGTKQKCRQGKESDPGGNGRDQRQ